mmetsp:Transcript_917/g.3165  ORF Transcript_917/g.3165 Transcript_917/m.3165 type:complete len:148 (+) Transcript_917:2493-2936(+)
MDTLSMPSKRWSKTQIHIMQCQTFDPLQMLKVLISSLLTVTWKNSRLRSVVNCHCHFRSETHDWQSSCPEMSRKHSSEIPLSGGGLIAMRSSDQSFPNASAPRPSNQHNARSESRRYGFAPFVFSRKTIKTIILIHELREKIFQSPT